MKKKFFDFNDFFMATVLAKLFLTGSDNPDFVAQKIVDGLKKNSLLHHEELDDDELFAA